MFQNRFLVNYNLSPSFKELLKTNSIQVEALAQLMIRKGFITEEEIFDMLKEVQTKYQNKSNNEDTGQYLNEQLRGENIPLILRRFLNDRIELISTKAESSTVVTCVKHTKSKWKEDVIIYAIELGKGHSVRPADLRRFIHDNEKIRELIAACIQDNVEFLSYNTWSETLKDRMESHLRFALSDLISVFEVESVECSSEGARIIVTTQGLEKDGSHGSYCVSVMPFEKDEDEQ